MPNGGYYRRSDGLPLMIESGAYANYPARECCCVDGGSGCGSCDPALEYSYTVTFSGLGGDFAWANGSHVLINDGTPFPGSHESGCYWHKEVERTEVRVGLTTWTIRMIATDTDPHDWVVVLRMSTASCYVQFRLEDVEDICDGPAGSYTEAQCSDSGCPYRNGDGFFAPIECYEPPDTPTSPPKPDCACYASGSATCVVS